MSSEKVSEKKENFTKRVELSSPDVDGGWAWVILIVALLSMATYSGLYYTFSVHYLLIMEEFQSSRALTAWAGSINNGTMMLVGPVAAFCITKFGIRFTVMLGGILTLTGFATSSTVSNIATLYFTYGIIAAFGCCLIYTGVILAIPIYFHKKYSLAMSVAQAGVGIGLFVFGPLYHWLAEKYGWRGSYLISGAIGFHLTLFGALISPPRQRKAMAVAMPETDVLLEVQSNTEPVKDTSETSPAVKSNDTLRQYILHVSNFFWLMATLIPFNLLGDFVVSKSLDDYYIYALQAIGVGDFLGRLMTGPLTQYFSIDLVKFCVASQLVCTLIILLFPVVVNGIQLVVQALIFGATYGCQCVLLATVPHKIFGKENLNAIFGLTMFFGGAGIFIGPPIAGLLVDLTKSYLGVFIFSGAGQFVATVCTFLLLFNHPCPQLG